ncbi:MAG: hypothetical protein V7641_844 [Blastocatellia bacterium]
MKNADADSVTAFLKRATDILFVQNPKGTALGVLFGFMLYGLSLMFAPALGKISFIDLTKVYAIYYVIFGMFVFNIRSYFRRREFSPEIEKAFEVIREARKSGNMGELEAKIEYRKLIHKVLEEVTIKVPPTPEPRRRKPIASKSQSGS